MLSSVGYAEVRLKKRTTDLYHQFEARTYAALGHLRLSMITTRKVQLFILNLQEDGINERTGRTLAPKTIKNYLSFVSTILTMRSARASFATIPVAVSPCPLW